MSPFTPWWRRRSFIVPMVLAVALTVAGLISFRAMMSDSKSPTPGLSNGMQVVAPVYSGAAKADNEEAQRIKHTNPEFYQCSHYPDDAHLRRIDLVPTANVVMNIRFDPTTKQYTVENDPRIHVTKTTRTEPANSDSNGRPVHSTVVSWTLNPSVAHFAVYSQIMSDVGLIWWPEPIAFNTKTGAYQMRLYADGDLGKNKPLYTLIATDTTTCAPGTVQVPIEMDWTDLAAGDSLKTILN